MNELTLIKSADFGGVQCDFYGDSKELFMTRKQIGQALKYSNPQVAIDKLHKRNKERLDKYSVTTKLVGTDGKSYDTTVYNQKGIMEICRWSQQPKANEFIDFVWNIMDSLMKGKTKLVGMSEYQKMMAETRQRNTRIRSAQLLTRLAEKYDGTTYQQILNAYATKELTGDFLLPLPQLPEKTYTATEIGNQLGISANMVGILTNRHNLKTDQYGAWYNDKAKKINKEVPTFRYYENVIPVLKSILDNNQTRI